MAITTPQIRIVTATVKDGRVGFNQVVKLKDESQPAGVLMAGWDPDEGVYIWLKGHDDVTEHASGQHGGYSLGVGRFSVETPPDWLGAPTLLSKEVFEPWPDIKALNTNAKRAAIIKALNAVL